MIIQRLMAAAILSVATGTAALAHGSIAIGEPDDVAKGGLAVGYTWNHSSAGEAEAAALKQCLSYMDAPDSTRALCKIVDTFSNQCFAISLDPNAGTEGFGWAVAATQQEAADSAMQKCRDTDGADHADACVVSTQKCDVTK
jgi:hypothetical protein